MNEKNTNLYQRSLDKSRVFSGTNYSRFWFAENMEIPWNLFRTKGDVDHTQYSFEFEGKLYSKYLLKKIDSTSLPTIFNGPPKRFLLFCEPRY